MKGTHKLSFLFEVLVPVDISGHLGFELENAGIAGLNTSQVQQIRSKATEKWYLTL